LFGGSFLMSYGFSNARVSEPSDTLSWCTKFTRNERKDAHDSPKPNSGTYIWLPPEPLPRSQDHPGQTPTNRNPARSQQCWATVLAAGFPCQGKVAQLPKPGAMTAVFKDGSRVNFRPTSGSDGSPVIEIAFPKPTSGVPATQKIHFVEVK